MKSKILVYSLLVLSLTCNYLFAQNDVTLLQNVKPAVEEVKKHKVDAQPFLEAFYKKNNVDVTIPVQHDLALKKTTSWNVNDKKTWQAQDFIESQYYEVPSTCVYVGTHCYIFVEDAIWGSTITQTMVKTVGEAFDSKTPANASKGIFQTNTEIFGNPPNIDGDDKIVILILDIVDSYSATNPGYIAGYFGPINEYPKVEYANSNETEIYYLDGVQNGLSSESGLYDAMSTTAHEFQHMIHFNYMPGDETFINECFSLTAEIINGYSIYSPNLYTNEPNQFLLKWRTGTNDVYTDYSRGARFGLYLYEQFGSSLFTQYLSKKISGLDGLDIALKNIGSSRRVYNILPDWFIANYLDDKGYNALYGYSYSGLPKMAAINHKDPNVTATKTVYALGVQYISFKRGENLNITFTKNSSMNLKIKAIKIGSTQKEVSDVAFGTAYSVPEFGSTYSEITFIVYPYSSSSYPASNSTNIGPYSFSYTSTGTANNKQIEIAYDSGEPDYAQATTLVAQDTIAVVFEGISGLKLDSIRVALRQAGSMTGGVWEYSGVLQPTPLGKKLVSVVATSTIAERPSSPYPVPYTNWVKVDLTNDDIDVSQSFVVGFVMAGPYQSDGSGDNRVMVEESPGTSPYPSVTYLHNPSSGSARWVYLVGEGTVYNYLIRAYVSDGTTDAKETIELLPTAYSLDQNYPNPFNPSTIISYKLPKASNVNIKIFDALGKEVRSLIDEEKSAGKYNIMWDSRNNYGQRVSSGIYFYTINAGDFVQTKKMVLVK